MNFNKLIQSMIDYTTDPERPFVDQPHTTEGKRGKTEVKVKYFINSREPGATDLAEQMRQAGINFSSLPTFGPMTLWIDGRCVGYGATAVKYAVHQLIERKVEAKGD